MAPIYVVEVWRHRDASGDERLLRKALDVAEQRDADRSRVVPVAIYRTDADRRGVRLADVGPPGDRAIVFRPRRIVLSEVDPAALRRAGGAALVVLPLVGTEDQVRRQARGWRRRLQRTTTLGTGDRERALQVFTALLADRIGAEGAASILGTEAMMGFEKTTLGRWLLARARAEAKAQGAAQGEARGLRKAVEILVRARFGRVPRPVAGRLRTIEDPARLTRLLVAMPDAESLADVSSLLR